MLATLVFVVEIAHLNLPPSLVDERRRFAGTGGCVGASGSTGNNGDGDGARLLSSEGTPTKEVRFGEGIALPPFFFCAACFREALPLLLACNSRRPLLSCTISLFL